MRVVGMFRVSTDRQANEGASLAAQERRFTEMAEAQGWQVVATYRGSESATKAASEREVLQDVLACVRRQRPDALYVHEQSRLTRGDELEVALLMRELRDQGVKVLVAGVVRELASIDDRFMFGIQSLVDRAEADRIQERVARGRREKAKQGLKNCGPSPFGYRNPPAGSPDRGKLEIVEDKAAVVRRIFAMAAAGAGEQGIATTLNSEGVPASRGGRWVKSSVKRVLTHPAYIGVQASGCWIAEPGSRTFRFDPENPKAIVVENSHPPIVDRETWDLVHSRPKKPCNSTPRMLTGLLFANGDKMSGEWSKNTKFYRVYKSKNKPWLAAHPTEEIVWNALASLATRPEQIVSLGEESANQDRLREARRQMRDAERQELKLKSRLDRLTEMRADGDLSREAFQTKKADATEQLRLTRLRIAELSEQLVESDPGRLETAARAVQAMLEGHERLTTEQRASLVRSLVTRIDVRVSRHGEERKRDNRGRMKPGKGPVWGIQEVSFSLGVPLSQDRDSNTKGFCWGPLDRARR